MKGILRDENGKFLAEIQVCPSCLNHEIQWGGHCKWCYENIRYRKKHPEKNLPSVGFDPTEIEREVEKTGHGVRLTKEMKTTSKQ